MAQVTAKLVKDYADHDRPLDDGFKKSFSSC